MSDPSLAVQKAIATALLSAGLCDGRIYDRIPDDAPFPHISIGEGTSIDDGACCLDASEVNVNVHVWSRGNGYPEAKSIGSEIRDALGIELDLGDDFACVVGSFEIARYMKDPDGMTSHGVLSFRYLIDHIEED